jgi:hypothetical protein
MHRHSSNRGVGTPMSSATLVGGSSRYATPTLACDRGARRLLDIESDRALMMPSGIARLRPSCDAAVFFAACQRTIPRDFRYALSGIAMHRHAKDRLYIKGPTLMLLYLLERVCGTCNRRAVIIVEPVIGSRQRKFRFQTLKCPQLHYRCQSACERSFIYRLLSVVPRQA